MPVIICIPKTRDGWVILCFILAAISLVGLVISGVDWLSEELVYIRRGQPYIHSLGYNQLEDKLYVEGMLDVVIDMYGETYYEGEDPDEPIETTALFYCVPIFALGPGESSYINYFITYEAQADRLRDLEKIYDYSWGEGDYHSIGLKGGQLVRLSEEIEAIQQNWMDNQPFYDGGTIIDWCVENSIFDTDDRNYIKSRFLPYMIKEGEARTSGVVNIAVFGALTAIFIAGGLYFKMRKKPFKWLGEEPPDPVFEQLKRQFD
ncbi:MAG: hypothetical protein ACOYJD_02920 [Christensenellales bacterium]